MPSRILPFASCSGLPKKLYKFKGNKKKKLRSAVSGDVVFCLNQLLVKLATCVSKARLHYIPSKRGSETTLIYVYIWRVHHNATKWYYCEKLSSFWKSLKYMQHISNTYTTWFFPRQALNTGKANQNKEIALFYFWRRLQTQTDKLWKGDIPEAGLPGYPA